MRALIVLVGLLAPRLAFAQLYPGPPGAMPPAAASSDDKDPRTALALSLGVTVGGLLTGAVGIAAANSHSSAGAPLAIVGGTAFLLGPTIGHAYAGDTWSLGFKLRALGIGAFVAGVLLDASGDGFVVDDTGDDPAEDARRKRFATRREVGGAMVVGGFLLFVGGTVYEICDAPGTARRHNREHAKGIQLGVAPAPIASRDGISPGIVFSARF